MATALKGKQIRDAIKASAKELGAAFLVFAIAAIVIGGALFL